MEQRKHPRIKLPLEIDLRHPLIGTRTVVARDTNEDGVFAWYPDAPLKIGSSIDVTLRSLPMIESSPTPTVKMTVYRVDENGLVLRFSNKSGAHLWRSALAPPQEIDLGKDIFRVFQSAIVRDPAGRILTVQQNGHWLFPGAFLQTHQSWLDALQNYLGSSLSLTDTQFMRTVLIYCDPEVVAVESSTMSVFHLFTLNTGQRLSDGNASPARATLSQDAPYTDVRWLNSHRQLDELRFSAEPLRELARSLLRTGSQARAEKAAQYAQSYTHDSKGTQRKHG